MPEKKNQHLVPACYLRNFEADVSRMREKNPKFTGGIYVNNNKLTDKWKLKSVTHSTFTKPYFYNLPEDNPKKPVIEDYLSIVEGDYVKYSNQIINGDIDNENLSFMSYFVTLQFMRVESFIDENQHAWDKIAKWMDDFEGKENHKDVFKDIVKRGLISQDLGHVIHPHAVIIYNETNFPFITSDNPVVRRQINITDAIQLFPGIHLQKNDNESVEYPLLFMPISPTVAYVSCELIKPLGHCHYSMNDLSHMFFLNYYSIVNSYYKVFSSVIEPMKCERELAEYLANANQTLIKIYTKSKRFIIHGSIEENENCIITLKINDKQQIENIKNGEDIQLVEVIRNGRSIRGMRDCKVTAIDYDKGLITIEANFKF
ncbi:MAG: hypothetical protein COA71_08585 [SAR86 cluster bacterium]|uniref:DUF4238 domain-containing protein n=1 Tax=SAR86 cluster bacterium TaxID=2030880 RepID=A0A2A5CB32_9GAMM|nr:MAG: hypothetical protein COA71_08585 [SAR86 cluster bacterium]